jgi:hypothetical protein
MFIDMCMSRKSHAVGPHRHTADESPSHLACVSFTLVPISPHEGISVPFAALRPTILPRQGPVIPKFPRVTSDSRARLPLSAPSRNRISAAFVMNLPFPPRLREIHPSLPQIHGYFRPHAPPRKNSIFFRSMLDPHEVIDLQGGREPIKSISI